MERLTRQPARLRPLDEQADHAEVSRLDLSFLSHRVFVVHRRATGFEMVEEAPSSPIEGRHEVAWAELANSAYAMVAEQAGRIVGVAALGVSEWNRRGICAHLYVDREWRRVGVGSQLVAAMERVATERGMRALWVETQNVNVAAFRFYESCGFELCGLDMSLYDPEAVLSETAIYLSKVLEKPRAAPVSGGAAE